MCVCACVRACVCVSQHLVENQSLGGYSKCGSFQVKPGDEFQECLITEGAAALLDGG